MRFRDVGVQLEYDGDFKIYREDGISRYGKPDYLFLYFHTECCVVHLISSRFMLSRLQ